MKKLTYILAGVVALSALQASAADGFTGAIGLLAAQGSSSTLTQQTWGGYTYELGYQFTPQDYGVSFLPYVGWGRMTGKKNIENRSVDSLWGPNTYDMTSWRGGFDIIIKPSERLPLTVNFGPSLHTWQMDRKGVVERPLGDLSVKMGWRLGLEYAIAPDWSACVYFTQSEWRGLNDVSSLKGGATAPSNFIDGLNPSKPAYFSIMCRHQF